MKLKLLAVALSMSCLATACSKDRIATALPTPPERLICEAAGDRPVIPPEYVIDWSKVMTVPQARVEHDAYVRSIRSREGVIVAYLMTIEGKLFVCSNNAQWRRDYEAALPKPVP